MSSDRLDIAIRAVNQASKAIREVNKDLGDMDAAGNKSKSGLQKFGEGAKSVVSFGAQAVTAIVGVGVAMDQIFEIGKRGAQLEYTSQKFDKLSQSIGTTSDVLMKDLKAATRGMVSDAELMGSATDFMALGLVKNHDEAVRLTRAAGALNMNMNQLVLTLTNMTTMRFDALGVSVDGFKEKVKALEAQGLSAEEAFRTAFLEQAEAQIEKVGDAADSAIAPFQRMDVATKNIADAFSKWLAPGLAQAAEGFENLLIGHQKVREAFASHAVDIKENVLGGAFSLEEYNDELLRSATLAGQISKLSKEDVDSYREMGVELNSLTGQFITWRGEVYQNFVGVRLLDEATLKNMRTEAEYARGKQELARLTQEVVDKQKGQIETTEQVSQRYQDLKAVMAGVVGKEMKDYSKSQDDNRAKAAELRAELEKLEATQGRAVTTTKKQTLTENELALKRAQLADATAKYNDIEDKSSTKALQLQVQMDKLSASINGTSTATTSYVDNSKKMGEIQAQLDELDVAYASNAAAHEEATHRILFDIASQQLAMDGLTANEVDALTTLASQWGLMDQATATATQNVLLATLGLAEDQNIGVFQNRMNNAMMGVSGDLGNAALHAEQLQMRLDNLQDRSVTVTIRTVELHEQHEVGPGRSNPLPGGYQHGGIASGPASGYPVTLHGTEAILPLRDTNRTLQLMLAVLQQMSGGMGGRTVNFYTSAPLSAERDGATIRALAGAI